MTDVARLPFGSSERPAEQGTLVLSDDGAVRIEPSEELRDALAEQEEIALARANRYGTQLGLGLVAAGLAAIAAGWYAGRVWGKSAGQLLAPRSLQDVSLQRSTEGILQVTLGRTVWRAGTCSEADTTQFLQVLEEMQR